MNENIFNVKKEDNREKYVKSRLAYHTVGKYKNNEYKNNPKADRTPSSTHIDMEAQIRVCMNELDLPSRITLFKNLLPVVHRASVPYIEFLIRKYTKKLDPFSDRS